MKTDIPLMTTSRGKASEKRDLEDDLLNFSEHSFSPCNGLILSESNVQILLSF